MTVVRDTGQPNDHTVGLMVVSRHQGFWNHSPSIKGVSTGTRHWLIQNAGVGAGRLERGQTQFTGHTAVMARLDGKVILVQGWATGGLLKGIAAAVFGRRVKGAWQDDTGMIDDPTSLSYEIPVERRLAEVFPKYLAEVKSQIVHYQLRPTTMHNESNCVMAAITVVVNFILTFAPERQDAVEQISNIVTQTSTRVECQQGHLIQNMMRGFQPK